MCALVWLRGALVHFSLRVQDADKFKAQKALDKAARKASRQGKSADRNLMSADGTGDDEEEKEPIDFDVTVAIQHASQLLYQQ